MRCAISTPNAACCAARRSPGTSSSPTCIALAIFYTYFYLRRNVFHPRSLFATMLFINTLYCVVLSRLLARPAAAPLRERAGIDRRPAILVGRNRDADFLHGLIGRFALPRHLPSPSGWPGRRSVAIAELLERIRRGNA